MSKKELIELILDRLSGGDAPQEVRGRYHPEIISKHIGMAYRTLVSYTDNLDSYSKSYITSVSLDIEREQYYSDLTASIVILPENAGIKQISPVKDQATSFIPIGLASYPVFSELEVSKVDDVPAFSLEGSKVYYTWMKEDITSVLMKLVVEFDEYDDDDDINILAGKEENIFQIVVNNLMGKPLEDLKNDNA